MNSAPVKLRKNLSLFNCVGIIMGYVIGSGIFISASTVVRGCGSTGLSMVIWVLTGLVALTGGLSYAELGSAITKSGGEYAYLQRSYGNLFAFLFSWTLLVILMPAGTSVSALAFGYYCMKSIYPSCDPPVYLILLVSDLSIILVGAMNCFSVKFSTIVQNIFTAAKAVSLIIIVAVGFDALRRDPSIISKINMEGTSTQVGPIALSLYGGIFTYSGWFCLNPISEEIVNPKRNLPLAIIFSIVSVIVIYVFVNLAYFVVIPKQELLTTNTIGLSFAAHTTPIMLRLLPIFVTLSTFGSMNAGFLSSRAFFAAGRDGNLPRLFSLVTINLKTPAVPIIFSILISFIIVSVNDIDAIINLSTFAGTLFQTLTISTIFYMRKYHKDYNPIFRVNPIFPLFFILAGIFLLIVTLYAKPRWCGLSFLIILCGIPVYYIFVKGIAHIPKYKQISNIFSEFLQKILVSDFAQDEDYVEEDIKTHL